MRSQAYVVVTVPKLLLLIKRVRLGAARLKLTITIKRVRLGAARPMWATARKLISYPRAADHDSSVSG